MIPRKLQRIVSDDPVLSNLRDRTQPLRDLQALYTLCVPSNLRSNTRVGSLDGDVLKLFADTGAAATRLRLLAPVLLGEIRSKGWQVSSIRVAVQVRTDSRTAGRPTPKFVDPEGQKALAKLAGTLPESPLRDAIERLSKRSRRVG